MNSPMAAVCEGLQLFGKEAMRSPLLNHIDRVKRRYLLERSQAHWENTGRWLKERKERKSKTRVKRERREKKDISFNKLMEAIV